MPHGDITTSFNHKAPSTAFRACYDGQHAPGAEMGYTAFLRAKACTGADPRTGHVISAVNASRHIVNGWNMRDVHLPSRGSEAHSETAHTTDQAIGYIDAMGSQPWVLHLNFVKPHWPCMAPAPHHAMYTRCTRDVQRPPVFAGGAQRP